MEDRVYDIYEYAEVLSRILAATAPLDGPSGFPVEVKFLAGNTVEPPVISVDVYEGDTTVIFSDAVDQNTPASRFWGLIHSLRSTVEDCLKSRQEKKTVEEIRRERAHAQEDSESDLPF